MFVASADNFCLLTLDDLHVRGLAGISGRSMPRHRGQRCRWFPAAEVYFEDVPVRELDDPPDSEVSLSVGDGLIVKCSAPSGAPINRHEDNFSS